MGHSIMIRQKNKGTFLSIYLTFFVDYLSWSVVFPIFAPYFIDVNNQVFSPEVLPSTRTMILGFFLTAFSLGQFLGAPLIGEYADKHGRKKALTISVFFTLVGLCLTAYSMHANHLALLFIGRFMNGLFAGSAPVCLSCISDLSENEKAKVKNFGTLSMIAGFAFILGAFAGGKLSDQTLSHSFSASVPLWLSAGLTLINFVFVVFGFRETAEIHPNVRFHLLESFKHIQIALRTEKIKRIYIIYFLFFLSWTILFQFIPVLMVERFDFTNSNIGDLALFMGVCWAIGSGYLNKYVSQQFDAMQILEVCLIGIAVFSGLMIFPKHIYNLLMIIGLCVISGGIAWPICTGLISNMAPKEMQGKILGLSQSIQSFAMTIGPVIGGLTIHFSLKNPFLIAAGISLLAVIIYYFILKHR